MNLDGPRCGGFVDEQHRPSSRLVRNGNMSAGLTGLGRSSSGSRCRVRAESRWRTSFSSPAGHRTECIRGSWLLCCIDEVATAGLGLPDHSQELWTQSRVALAVVVSGTDVITGVRAMLAFTLRKTRLRTSSAVLNLPLAAAWSRRCGLPPATSQRQECRVTSSNTFHPRATVPARPPIPAAIANMSLCSLTSR